jgi:hypothetical protein
MEQSCDMKKIPFLLFTMHVGTSTRIWQKAGSNMQVTFVVEVYVQVFGVSAIKTNAV